MASTTSTSTTLDMDFEDVVDTADGTMGMMDSQQGPGGKTHEFTNFPHSAADSDDEEDTFDKSKLLKEEKKDAGSFWTFGYYQQFFDVETHHVSKRIVGSMVPYPGRNYLVRNIRPNPDLYGPFWICTTLVFTTAIAGNLANYFSYAGKNYHWSYDFHKVTLAATAIFSYWWLIPLVLYSVLWWRKSQAQFSFMEMLCVYGYSLSIYIPISILWAIQIPWLQWTLVLVGAALSGSVLLLTFWPAVSADSRKIAIGLMIFIFIMHASLAAGFVLYFFHVPAHPAESVKPASSTVTPPANAQAMALINKLGKQDKLTYADNPVLNITRLAQEGAMNLEKENPTPVQAGSPIGGAKGAGAKDALPPLTKRRRSQLTQTVTGPGSLDSKELSNLKTARRKRRSPSIEGWIL